MKKILVNVLAAILFVAGFFVLVYPIVREKAFQYEKKQEIKVFREKTEKEETQTVYADLLKNMQEYNRRIYEEKQTGLKDAWSYRENVFDFSSLGISDDMIGYISIEAMDIEIPLYIGASVGNLKRGAAVLTQTSMPIGSENANCVIAGHRGYNSGYAMFRDIEMLQPGDKVKITNFWGTLEYEVIKTIVTVPQDVEAVKIVEGEDMVTLVTCHPYGDNYQRYIVYCSRVQPKESPEDNPILHTETKEIAYQSSQSEIFAEKILRISGFILFGAGVLFVIGRMIFRRRKNK